MSKGSTKLAVVGPHRDEPKDIAYVRSREFAFCRWCAHFHDGWALKRGPPVFMRRELVREEQCRCREIDPDPHSPNKVTVCAVNNPEGRCPWYRPSWWTRIVRLVFGARKPVMR